MTRRVLYAGPVPPIPGGIAQHGARLVAALRDAGCEVTVVSWRSQYPPLLYRGARRDPRAAPFPGARFRLRWWDPTSWVLVGRQARRHDLLVMPWVTPVHALPQRVIMAVAGVPTTLFVHNAIPHERLPFDEWLARWTLGAADHAVTHAATVADEITRLAPGTTTAVVPHPPNLRLAPTPLPADGPLRLLCLGYVRAYKGFDLAVDAVEVLAGRGTDVRLTIAGELWDDREAWDARLARVGDRVQLTPGYVDDDEIARLLASHHLVVAPYRSATQSGVVPLAYAAGRPVVATGVGGLREAVADGRTGVLVAPDDATALADGIERARADLAALAAGATAQRWSWDDVARAVLQPTDDQRRG